MLRHAQRACARVRGGEVGAHDGEAVCVCQDERLGANGDDAEEHAGGDGGDEACQGDGRAEGTGADAGGVCGVTRVGQGRGHGTHGALVTGSALEL
eukprot:5841337-Pleurochrysis_carterae.AAC.1